MKGVTNSTPDIWGNEAFIAVRFGGFIAVSTAVLLGAWECQVCARLVGGLTGFIC